MIARATIAFVAIHLALVGATSCDWLIDLPVKGEADYGRVFVCETPCTKPDGEPGYEWCWDGDADELGALKNDSCRSITVFDRAWPAIAGCAYDCAGRLTGAGANAHCGTYCRPPEE